jgi:ubiquinone/menaquinone biosynthesis C-methylase UbiE
MLCHLQYREEFVAESAKIYDSFRLAAGYAYDRPPVHRHIIQSVKEYIQLTGRFPRALDVGCGAGISTAALKTISDIVIGLEPVRTMLTHCRSTAPNALFLIGRAETLPFEAEVFDLVTAAGSLNYADLDLFFPEAARVLKSSGHLIIYDFSGGRHVDGEHRLHEWFAMFESRYPAQPNFTLNVRKRDYRRFGLRLEAYKEMDIAVPMTFDAYLAYVLSETRVELAIARGAPVAEIQDWCQHTLQDKFGDTPENILFNAYVAYVRRYSSDSPDGR